MAWLGFIGFALLNSVLLLKWLLPLRWAWLYVVLVGGLLAVFKHTAWLKALPPPFDTALPISVVVVLLCNLMASLAQGLVAGLVWFHRRFNADGLQKQPVKLLIECEQGLKRGYVWFFAAVPWLVFYGLWLGSGG